MMNGHSPVASGGKGAAAEKGKAAGRRSDRYLLGYRLFGPSAVALARHKIMSVMSFVCAVLGGAIPFMAAAGVLPRPIIHFSLLTLGTITQRALMLDTRAAWLLIREFEMMFLLVNWLGFFVGMGVLFGWDDRTVFVLINGMVSLSYCFSDATALPAKRQIAGFTTLFITGIVFAVAVEQRWLVDCRYEDIAIHFFGIKQTAQTCVEGRIITLTTFWAKYMIWSIRRPGYMVMLKFPIEKDVHLNKDQDALLIGSSSSSSPANRRSITTFDLFRYQEDHRGMKVTPEVMAVEAEEQPDRAPDAPPLQHHHYPHGLGAPPPPTTASLA